MKSLKADFLSVSLSSIALTKGQHLLQFQVSTRQKGVSKAKVNCKICQRKFNLLTSHMRSSSSDIAFCLQMY